MTDRITEDLCPAVLVQRSSLRDHVHDSGEWTTPYAAQIIVLAEETSWLPVLFLVPCTIESAARSKLEFPDFDIGQGRPRSSCGHPRRVPPKMSSEDGVRPRTMSFRRPPGCGPVHPSGSSSPSSSAPLSPKLRGVRRKAIGLIRRTLGSLSNSSTPVGSTESLPDAVFASSASERGTGFRLWESLGSRPNSRPATPTTPDCAPHVGLLFRVSLSANASRPGQGVRLAPRSRCRLVAASVVSLEFLRLRRVD